MRHKDSKTRSRIGIKDIDNAEWILDEHKTLNLYVTDKEGRSVHAFLSLRQQYCDRGHIQLNIDGHLNLDAQDSFPRFFFSLDEAKKHTKDFLKWRIWKHTEFADSKDFILLLPDTKYLVTHTKGTMVVIANSEEEAREQYYDSIRSMIGHHLKICRCFGEEKPLDRSKVNTILKIEECQVMT